MNQPLFHLDFLHRALPSMALLLEQFAMELSPEEDIPTASSMFPGGYASQALAVSALRYIRAGRQTFAMGPRLQEMLAATSLQGIDFEDLRLPYDAFYMAFSDCPWNLWGGPSGWHPIDGVYLSKEKDGKILFAAWGKPHGNRPDDDAIRWWRIDLKDALANFTDLEDYLQHLLDDTEKHINEVTGLDSEEVTRETLMTSEAIVRVAFNLAQYLSSSGAETRRCERSIRKREKLEKKLGKTKHLAARRSLLERMALLPPPVTITTVGPSIEKTSRDSSGKPSRGSVKRHWVRGHWRDVPYGPRSVPLAERPRRRRWVQPFEKGVGELGARKYEVQEKEDLR